MQNTHKKHYAPYLNADAIKAAESAEANRILLEEAKAAWDAAGKPRGGKEEKHLADVHAAWEDSCRLAGAEARKCLAVYLAR